GEPIKEGGFAHIRPAYDDQGWFHEIKLSIKLFCREGADAPAGFLQHNGAFNG
ncbi:MAG: hypothetical protein RIR70_404, partial [Pseudomonadota bacterium]